MLDMNSFHELRYKSRFNAGRGLSFPCDPDGRVQMNVLSKSVLANYLFARAVVGR
jgi:hypothetical protein